MAPAGPNLLGCQDSNLGIAAPKAAALPLGYTPVFCLNCSSSFRPEQGLHVKNSCRRHGFHKKQSPTRKRIGLKK